MMESWDVVGMIVLTGVISTVINLLKIIVPLMIFIEILMVYNIVEKLALKMNWFAKLIGVSKEAVFPLLVGVIMGISYGAGTLIAINSKTPLPKRDMILIGIFLFICHAIVEAGLLFGIVGADIWVITLGRFLLAMGITMISARLPWIRRLESGPVLDS